MTQFTREYLDYIASDEWRAKCNRLIHVRGHQCERCHRHNVVLQGHHKTYERLKHERDEDIEILCEKCHPKADRQRKELRDRHLEQKRIDAWAKKVYGEDWFDLYSTDSVHEAFYAWLETKQRADATG